MTLGRSPWAGRFVGGPHKEVVASSEKLLMELRTQIASMEAECAEDCQRYEAETRDRIRRRWERFEQETSVIRKHIQAIVTELCRVEATKMPKIVIESGKLE